MQKLDIRTTRTRTQEDDKMKKLITMTIIALIVLIGFNALGGMVKGELEDAAAKRSAYATMTAGQ